MKKMKYYEETSALLYEFSEENQKYFEELWDSFNLAGFLYDEDYLREQIYLMMLDFSEAERDGMSAEEYLGKNPKKLMREMLKEAPRSSIKESLLTPILVLAVLRYYQLLSDFSKGPLKMISPGRVFRRDTDDATHSHQFHQIEGLVVGKNISMADLQGTLQLIVQKMFGEDRSIRLRPSYFPFTEPSVEVDVSCFKCGGQGCNVCKKTGWIEIMGAGMVHPRVLEMSGIDADVYSGFAFGLGQERVAMLRYGINDIRGFYQGDVRFSEQFK